MAHEMVLHKMRHYLCNQCDVGFISNFGGYLFGVPNKGHCHLRLCLFCKHISKINMNQNEYLCIVVFECDLWLNE